LLETGTQTQCRQAHKFHYQQLSPLAHENRGRLCGWAVDKLLKQLIRRENLDKIKKQAMLRRIASVLLFCTRIPLFLVVTIAYRFLERCVFRAG